MNRYNNDSTSSLTSKSALYNIYKDGDINNDMDNTNIYSNLNSDLSKHPVVEDSQKSKLNSSKNFSIISFGVNIFILGILGNFYFLLLESIDIGKKIQLPSLEDFKILFIFTDFFQNYTDSQTLNWLNNAIFGVLLGTIDSFIFDSFFKSIFNIPNRSSYETTTIIRSLVATIGISYGLKNLEWESSLQASMAWSLLNPCLWILLDGTVYGFIIDSTISILFCFLGYYYDPGFFQSTDTQEFWNQMLWLGSAGFVGLLIFGKIGRFLFK